MRNAVDGYFENQSLEAIYYAWKYQNGQEDIFDFIFVPRYSQSFFLRIRLTQSAYTWKSVIAGGGGFVPVLCTTRLCRNSCTPAPMSAAHTDGIIQKISGSC